MGPRRLAHPTPTTSHSSPTALATTDRSRRGLTSRLVFNVRVVSDGSGSRSDDELIAAARDDPSAFGTIHRRHPEAVLRYLVYRTGSAEAAAELTAEVFAAAFEASARYRRNGTPARAWLFGIANHKLADSARQQQDIAWPPYVFVALAPSARMIGSTDSGSIGRASQLYSVSSPMA